MGLCYRLAKCTVGLSYNCKLQCILRLRAFCDCILRLYIAKPIGILLGVKGLFTKLEGCDGALGGHGWPCLDWLVPTKAKSNMQRSVLNRAAIEAADTTEVSGRVTADEVNLDRFHNRIRKVGALVL